MPTIGLLSFRFPNDPRKGAPLKVKMPPSAATTQKPSPTGDAAPPTMGDLSAVPVRDPLGPAAPKLAMAPSAPTVRYPGGGGLTVRLTEATFESPPSLIL